MNGRVRISVLPLLKSMSSGKCGYFIYSLNKPCEYGAQLLFWDMLEGSSADKAHFLMELIVSTGVQLNKYTIIHKRKSGNVSATKLKESDMQG